MRGSGIGLSADHEALQDTVRRWVESNQVLTTARATLDADPEELPPWWDELGAHGWLGLHLPEADGGSGFGLLESAVVLEELGRVCAPGAALPTAVASAAIDRFATGSLRDLLPDLATGSARAGVALECAPVAVEPAAPGADQTVSGTWDPVFGGAMATHLLLPVSLPEPAPESAIASAVSGAGTSVVTWLVVSLDTVDGGEAKVTESPGVDRTRWPATVEASRLPVNEAMLFDAPVGATGVEGLAALLAAAESTGVAAWCVETAAAHARQREQFGRPIGQFQAVKHRCADMLSTLEAARAATWDALGAVDRKSVV